MGASQVLEDPPTSLNPTTGGADVPQHRCLVISLIRHGQAESNRDGRWIEDDAPNPLTERGRLEAEALGQRWVDTRIDYLWSSPLERAHDTAKALSTHNKGHPEIEVNDLLVERRFGSKVARLMRQGYRQEAREEITGLSRFHPGPLNRSHRPAEGGESFHDVSSRAKILTVMLLSCLGVKLSTPPEFFITGKKTKERAVLPDGIPHVVIVSHNNFLIELYETWHSWNKDYRRTDCDYQNVEWSRHILWYDMETNELEVSDMKACHASLFDY